MTVWLDVLEDPEEHYYYAFVIQADAAAAMSSPIWVQAWKALDVDILRYELKASLAAGTPQKCFSSGGLPWLDPDSVLDPSSPPALFYDMRTPGVAIIRVLKDGMTVRIEPG